MSILQPAAESFTFIKLKQGFFRIVTPILTNIPVTLLTKLVCITNFFWGSSQLATAKPGWSSDGRKKKQKGWNLCLNIWTQDFKIGCFSALIDSIDSIVKVHMAHLWRWKRARKPKGVAILFCTKSPSKVSKDWLDCTWRSVDKREYRIYIYISVYMGSLSNKHCGLMGHGFIYKKLYARWVCLKIICTNLNQWT